MKKNAPFVIDQDIFIHLMTRAYKEGFKAGKDLSSTEYTAEYGTEAVTQFYHGLSDMLREPATEAQH